MPDNNYTLKATPTLLFKLLVPSLLGILVFFVPLPFDGKTTILLDHMVSAVRSILGGAVAYYAMAVIVAGALYPVITGHWRANRTERVFTVFKWVGVLCAIMALTGAGPSALHTPDMLPFLFDKLVISVA